MKTNKLIMGLAKTVLVFAGVLLVNAGIAQSQQNPTGAKVDDVSSDYGNVIMPAGFTPPTSPSVGVIIDATQVPRKMVETPYSEEKESPMPDQFVNPKPNYENVNITEITTADGATIRIKVESWEDELPAYIDTGDPVRDKANYHQVVTQWLLNNQ